MGTKIRLQFLFILLLQIFSTISKAADTISHVYVSNKIAYDLQNKSLELNEMEFPFFDTDTKNIYFFFNLQTSNPKPFSFIYVEIKKSSNMQFKMRPVFAKRIELKNLLQGSMLDSISMEESGLTSGNYDLIINYLSDSNKLLTRNKTSFQLLREAEIKDKQQYESVEEITSENIVDVEKTFAGIYSKEQLKRNIPALAPIAKGIEIKVIKEITSNEDVFFLKQFFYNFWQNRDRQNPEKAWLAYADKLNDISKKYGSTSQAGYETDRGRIYLQFGTPDIQERVVNEKGSLPYEVWFYYNTQGRTNVKFLFYQPGMLVNQMFILHSTEDDQMVNPSWKQYLLVNPNDKDSKLMHRVFEYFK